MDKQMYTGMILVNFQKAFNFLDHGVLLEKMTYFRFRTSAIKSLKQKTFGLQWWRFFKCGVPQSSVLEPLLFLLHVNDLSQLLSAGSYLYADDTCIFYQHENVKIIANVLNNEVSSLCQWFIDNMLSICFREDKTKSILFQKAKDSKEINISFAGHCIKQHNTQ